MKGRKNCKSGGGAESAKSGDKEFEQDLKDKPEARTNAKKIDGEAEERKAGGRAGRKHGGKAKHHEMKAHGEDAKHHMGRKPRKSGGRAGSDQSPFSSARHGTSPKGHKAELID